MIASAKTVRFAAKHLSLNDAVLAAVIAKAPLCTIRPHKNYYRELVESVIGQQLSLRSASAIEARFIALFEGNFPSPEEILSCDPDTLRSIGFSRAKAGYVRDIAQRVVDGRLRLDKLNRLSNEEIIENLVAVKGVGVWTAHMFLIFCMARLDVLPVGDLGVKNGVKKLYKLEYAPVPEDITKIAQQNNWHPYESVAAWYVWRSLDNSPG